MNLIKSVILNLGSLIQAILSNISGISVPHAANA